jgi:hypothetical protein
MARPKVVDLPGIGEGPGVAPVVIPEIEELAEKYEALRDKRVAALGKELAAKSELMDAMHEHTPKIGKAEDGTVKYHHDDLVVLLKPKGEDVKVKRVEAFEEVNVV